MVPKLCYGQEDNDKLAQEKSLEKLVIWNVSKALEKSPNIPLKATIKEMQDNLAKKQTKNLSSNQGSPEQYLTCAVLAWQQLGHVNIDSLYSFIEAHRNDVNRKEEGSSNQRRACAKVSEKLLADVLLDSGLTPPGPRRSGFGEVVKLPITTKKFILRMDQTILSPQQSKVAPAPIKEMNHPQDMQFLKEIQCICNKSCTSCTNRFLQLEEKEKELRQRAEQLAQRETERAELLEKAAAAWVDLESKYHSRLNAAKEQAEIAITKMERELEYRKHLKKDSKALAEELKELSSFAEAKQQVMLEIDEQVCKRACERMSIMEEVKKGDSAFTDQQCKEAQLDRDLKFKEQQARRKLFAAGNDLDSASALLVESERAMHAELRALKDQILAVTDQLLEEDDLNTTLKEQLVVVRSQREQLLADMDSCKHKCDKVMEKDLETLQKKTLELKELEKKVVECKCKAPQEKTVEVKRTPSLAITCTCIEEGPDPSCTCSTLNSTVLSNLLASLFRGLQSEVGDAGIMMPCTLLKCFEDGHNWEKNTPVKSHLKTFFSQLLIGELNIAIAVAIEKYHARWVGATCADMRVIPNIDDEQAKQMQEKAIEKRAQRLANKLAEDLFRERAEELTQNAKEICEAHPTTCECEESEKENEKENAKDTKAVYSCLVSQNVNPMNINRGVDRNKGKTQGTGWKQTQQAVLEMKVEIENLRKLAIKKQDLRMMEEKIKKAIKGNTPIIPPIEEAARLKNEFVENEMRAKLRYKSRKDYKPPEKLKESKFLQPPRKLGQSFAVNVCFCNQSNKQLIPGKKNECAKNARKRNHQPCPSNCACLNSVPDTGSLDRFVENWNKNMQEARLSGSGCHRMIKVKDSTNVTQIIQSEKEYGSQLIKDINKIQSGSGSLQKDSSKGSKKEDSGKAQKNVVIVQKGSKNSKTNSTKQNSRDGILKEASIKSVNNENESKNETIIQETGFKDEIEKSTFDGEEKPEEKQNKEKLESIEQKKSDLCKCSCYCDTKNIKGKCIVGPDHSIFAMIKDTIMKNLGPIIGIESQDEELCKCLNEKIDTSVKNILGSVDMENCKCVENEHLNQKPECKCDQCKCEITSDSKTVILTDKKPTHKLANTKEKSKNKYIKSDELLNSRKNIKGNIRSVEIENLNCCDCDSSTETLESLIEDCLAGSLSFEESVADNKNKEYLSSSVSSGDVEHFETKKFKNKYQEYETKVHKIKDKDSKKTKAAKVHRGKTNFQGQRSELNDIPQNQDNKNVNKNIEQNYSNQDLARVQSEYIGTINLDKSHDNSKESSSLYYTQPKIIRTKMIGDCSENLCKYPINNKTSGGDRMLINEQKEIIKPSNSTAADCCCDYKIKLLGVTLTNGITKEKHMVSNVDKRSSDHQILIKKINKQDQLDCICCNVTNPKGFTDLEENTFSLLEEYMKKRLEEYRISCKAHCFNPELEERMFNEIFKKVKQTVSDNVKQIDCQCSEGDTKDDESKNRAYDLLQEYLKIKIDRVKCQCEGAEFCKGNMLSTMYEKVCNQIEKDFNKIRNLCACNEENKQTTLETSDNSQMVSAQNSPIKQSENISSQVSNTDTIIKQQDCGTHAKEFKDIQTGNSIICTCQSFECCTTPITKSKYVIHHSAPIYNKIADTIGSKHKSDSQLLEVLTMTSDSIPNVDSHKMFHTEDKPSYPYIGYTMGYSVECDKSAVCSCPKCTAKKNKNIIQDMWSIYTNLKAPIQKYSYIMSSVPKTEMVDSSFIDSRINLTSNVTSDAQCNIGSDEMLLKVSKEKIRTFTKALDTSSFSEELLKIDRSSSTYRKLFDINFNNCVHRFKARTMNVSSLSHSSCDCRKVPVCHVKMLMENIEYKLVECKCTCDALDASVCPVHSSPTPQ